MVISTITILMYLIGLFFFAKIMFREINQDKDKIIKLLHYLFGSAGVITAVYMIVNFLSKS